MSVDKKLAHQRTSGENPCSVYTRDERIKMMKLDERWTDGQSLVRLAQTPRGEISGGQEEKEEGCRGCR